MLLTFLAISQICLKFVGHFNFLIFMIGDLSNI